MRLILTIFSFLLLTACGSDHPANGIWLKNDNDLVQIEPNGDHSFIVTFYKPSIFTGALQKSEVAGILEGDVIKAGNLTLLYKQKSDELVIRGNKTYKRISERQFAERMKKNEDHIAARKIIKDAKGACIAEYAKALQDGTGAVSAKCLELMK